MKLDKYLLASYSDLGFEVHVSLLKFFLKLLLFHEGLLVIINILFMVELSIFFRRYRLTRFNQFESVFEIVALITLFFIIVFIMFI